MLSWSCQFARLAVAGAVLACALPAAGQTSFELPAPGNRSVHDLAGVLSPQHIDVMERVHRELFEKTQVAVVVITVPSLDGEPISDFAVRVGTEWGVGKRDEDRGIVTALTIEGRGIHIATGYGVEGFLPDGRVGAILDGAVPILRRGDFSTGLLQISATLVAAAAEEYGVTVEGTAGLAVQPRQTGRRPQGGPLSSVLGLLMMVGLVYLFFRHPTLFFLLLFSGALGGRRYGMRRGGFGGGGFGGGSGFGGFGGGGFGGGGAGRAF